MGKTTFPVYFCSFQRRHLVILTFAGISNYTSLHFLPRLVAPVLQDGKAKIFATKWVFDG